MGRLYLAQHFFCLRTRAQQRFFLPVCDATTAHPLRSDGCYENGKFSKKKNLYHSNFVFISPTIPVVIICLGITDNVRSSLWPVYPFIVFCLHSCYSWLYFWRWFSWWEILGGFVRESFIGISLLNILDIILDEGSSMFGPIIWVVSYICDLSLILTFCPYIEYGNCKWF